MKVPEITKEEFLEAISLGIKEALLTALEAGDGYTGEIIREPFLKSIEEGIKWGFFQALPLETEIAEAIQKGIENNSLCRLMKEIDGTSKELV